MNTNLTYLIAILIVSGFGYVIYAAVRSYLRFYGTRLVTCPETKQAAAVSLDALDAAKESFMGTSRFQLSNCSRWPERKNCGQECLSQIEKAPESCLVRNIVALWYEGKRCAYCHKPFASVDDIFHHKPALLGPDQKTMEWGEVPPEKLPQAFLTALPVCWSCHMIETFRREHPDMVLDNPWQNRQGEWTHHESDTKPAERKVA
jgi:hypothetical protein